MAEATISQCMAVRKADALFDNIDSNSDGLVTRSELDAFAGGEHSAIFDSLDLNKGAPLLHCLLLQPLQAPLRSID